MLTTKEMELLRLINDAEERLERITFYDDQEEINDFQNKYGEIFQSLLNKRYVSGWIGTFCELSITKKGKQVLLLYQEKQKESIKCEVKNKIDKNALIWTIIGSIIGLISLLVMLF